MSISSKKCVTKFINHYKLVIAIILTVNVKYSEEISSNKGTEYFTDRIPSNDLSRRFTRQTSHDNNRCQIPTNPSYTKYIILGNQTTSNYSSRDFVSRYSILEISCSKGYSLSYKATNVSICLNGIWHPAVTACIRTCPSLVSTITTTVKCKYNNIALENCINPVSGTIARLSCNPLYEELNLKKNPIRACRLGRWDPSVPQCYPSCGIKQPKGKVNLIGGNNVTLGNYPWQAGIYDSTNKELKCGASILQENIILSAAHCFTDFYGNLQPSSNYLIAAGKFFRGYNDERDERAQYSNILAIHVPERYKGVLNMHSHDIAIVILSDPFTITENVQPVCIDLSEEADYLELSLNNSGVVTGWGYTEEGRQFSDVLKELIIAYIPYNECFNEVPNDFRRYITYDKICGGYLNKGMSVCSGDSGGGFAFKNILNDRYFVRGIVSTSPATAELACNSNQYSTFTSLAYHTSFVRELVALNQLQRPLECTHNDCVNDEMPVDRSEEVQINGNIEINRCRLPNMPPHSQYIFVNTNTSYIPENYASPTFSIHLMCNDGYSVVPSGTYLSFCVNGGSWQPPLGTCARVCPSLFSSASTIVKCELNGKLLENCNSATEGTKALFSCNTFYEEFTLEENSVRLCKDGKWNLPILHCYPICGTIQSNGEILIADSQIIIRRSDYPWHVGIYNIHKELICGGTIITPHIVLSAANCFNAYNRQPNDTIDDPAANYFVGAGKYYRVYDDERDELAQYSQIREIHIPNAFQGAPTYHAFDIAVIVLSGPFNMSITVQPACVQLSKESINSEDLLNNSAGIISGWDFIQPNRPPPSEELKETILPYVPHNKCLEEVSRSFAKYVTDDKICGGYLNSEKGIGFGDGGGGYIFKSRRYGRYYIEGIASSCALTDNFQCDLSQYSTFTLVSTHMRFIRDVIINSYNNNNNFNV